MLSARVPRVIKVGVLASGGGSNFEALTEACRRGDVPAADVALLISNKPGAGALERAARLGVEAMALEPRDFPNRATYFARLAEEFVRREVCVVCLAGFLLKIEATLLQPFRGRILNIHPALLPKHGGAGMYGRFVHEAVLKAGDKESGCSVHVVDEQYDHGPVLMQARVPVEPGDTAETLAARVLTEEHKLYPQALKKLISTLPESA
jgi:formyltetrahydrofolate-dependent phosphoribosylglycinamide formyltransferase